MDRKEETEAQSGTMSRVWQQEQLGAAEAGGVLLQSWRRARSWGSGFIFKTLGSHLGWIWEYRSGSRETGVG